MMHRSGEIRNTDKESRTVQFVISDESKDRHRTVLNMDGWNLENFNRNGIVGYQHDVYGAGMCKGPDPDSVIGKGRAWVENNGTRANGMGGPVLMGEVEFEPKEVNELADKVFKKVLHGTLNATSVGFRSIGGGTMVNEKTGEEEQMKEAPYSVPKNHTFYYEGQELLEFSVVNIPSNPNALKKNVRGFTANALRYAKERLGDEWTYGMIEQMRVVELIELLKNPEKYEGKKYRDIIEGNKRILNLDGISRNDIFRAAKNAETSGNTLAQEIEMIKELEEDIQETSGGQGRLETYKRKVKLITQTNGLSIKD